jgi:large subunit ribosomal protein L7Ae|tara:strand:- start:1565 stop:1921 length:357 start_codon:yes stop_codon:yes gene_type:complete
MGEKMASIEVPKESVDKIYEVIETAKTTGKIMKGTNETTKAIERGKAKFVAIAKDIDPAEIIMHIPVIAEEKDVPCFTVPSKEELGAAAGIQVGTGSVAVIEEGEAKNLIKQVLTQIK